MDFNFTHTIRNVECWMTMIGYTVSVSKFRPFQKSDSVMTSVNSISFRSFKFQWILVFKKHFHSLFGLYVLQNSLSICHFDLIFNFRLTLDSIPFWPFRAADRFILCSHDFRFLVTKFWCNKFCLQQKQSIHTNRTLTHRVTQNHNTSWVNLLHDKIWIWPVTNFNFSKFSEPNVGLRHTWHYGNWSQGICLSQIVR